ncbi:alpha/beta fold hydrolase [Streptomyces sp. NPDC048161]|uniref:alpha/beta fold hydrolase n=1 Tax=Streptomyces sp. NPDC048161 TaxID=3160985 RepID=UPI0033F410AB
MLCRRTLGVHAVAAIAATGAAALTLSVPPGEAAASGRLSAPQRPAVLTAGNGDVLSSEPGVFHLDPLKAIKVNASVHRIMYRTTDRTGKGIAVTGTVLNPATSPYGQRPIVAFAPGTQGLADKCAPSRQLAEGTEYEAAPIKKLLDQGYAVVVTDYQGLGTPGVHTYMDREAQGRAVLDSVRAAQRLPALDLPDAGPVALYGYSQGGGATASAAELAPAYAPELKLKGAVVGAPPADMNKVADSMDGSAYGAFFNYALSGLSTSHGIDIGPYLTAHGKRVTNDLRDNLCTTQALAKYPFLNSRFLTVDGRPLTERLKRAPWDRIVAEQQLGKRKPAVPVLLSHSALDDVVPQQVGKNLAADWCHRGVTVRFAGNHIPGHIAATVGTIADGLPWLKDRFAGKAAPNTC